ncbi:MAG: hypothetical protein AMJ84_00255 [Acidithiobacillales bacterium SM23_46]|nr:MAG: hypothetical protein AMJ84_00255 [Acidithiobacillales bacterium SM23_46]KPL29012.1 MAG: hypothetical protein AMJ72_00195 [Acidithiobacillales bacterium SM1_46]
MKKWLIILGGALLAAALAILGRDSRALRRTEEQRDEILQTGIDENSAKARKLAAKAEKRKADAQAAVDETVRRLDALDEKDNDMGDLLSDWQSERVRQRSG